MFYEKAALKNFTVYTGKDLRWSFFLQSWPRPRPTTLLKRDSKTGAFM